MRKAHIQVVRRNPVTLVLHRQRMKEIGKGFRILFIIYNTIFTVVVAKTVGLSDDIGRFRADPDPVVLSDDIIRRYRADPDNPDFDQDVNDIVAFVQTTFNCCGSTGPQSWVDLNLLAVVESANQPPFCAPCNSTIDPMTCGQYTFQTAYSLPFLNVTFEALKQGCMNVTQVAMNIATCSTAVGSAFKLIGVLVSICLIYCITN